MLRFHVGGFHSVLRYRARGLTKGVLYSPRRSDRSPDVTGRPRNRRMASGTNTKEDEMSDMVEIGSQAPNFDYVRADGTRGNLSSEWMAGPVIIVWLRHCG